MSCLTPGISELSWGRWLWLLISILPYAFYTISEIQPLLSCELSARRRQTCSESRFDQYIWVAKTPNSPSPEFRLSQYRNQFGSYPPWTSSTISSSVAWVDTEIAAVELPVGKKTLTLNNSKPEVDMTLNFGGHVKVIETRLRVQYDFSNSNGYGEKSKKPKTFKPEILGIPE